MVVGTPAVNPVDALFGKPSPSSVKKQLTKQVEEPPKEEQEPKGNTMLSIDNTVILKLVLS